MVPVAAVFQRLSDLSKTLGQPLLRKSYNISIRSRNVESRVFGAKNALFKKKLFKICLVGHSAALAKTPIEFGGFLDRSTTGIVA